MNKSTQLILIIAIPLLLLAFGIYYFRTAYIPKFRWDENYDYKNDQPYGLKLLYDVLSQSRTADQFVRINKDPASILAGKDTASLYFFAGYQYLISEENANKLADFVARGNTAFISNIQAEHMLFDKLTDSEHPMLFLTYYKDSMVNVAFNLQHSDSVFRFHYQVNKSKRIYVWMGIDSRTFDDSLSYYNFQRVSAIDSGLVDCFRVTHGKGTFIFHFNPILLTNYNLANENGLRYVNALLSGYNASKIYWDDYSKVYMPSNSGQQTNTDTPFRFILSERSLRWAWLLLCFLVLLYVIVNAKRRQARIPLIPENNNTTIEYLNSLASLHFEANSLAYIADEIIRQFYSFVKHKYGIAPKTDKEEFADLLAVRSGIIRDDVSNIFKYHREIKYNQQPEKQSLIDLYKATEYFYKNSK